MLRSYKCLRAAPCQPYPQIQTFQRSLQSKIQRPSDSSLTQQSISSSIIAQQEDNEDDKQLTDSNLTWKQYMKLYKTLSKWNLSLLNGVVTGSTAFICSGGILFGCTVPATLGCISLAISASTLNQVQEYQYDKLMLRTKLIRPLCTGKLTVNNAKLWSLLSLTAGMSTLGVCCGSTSAVIGLSTLFMYNLVYTPLKRVTPYNTEFGAIVGALPPQIGIAASHYYHGSEHVLLDTLTDPLCWYSFLLLYIWQMPHFLYLCIRNKQDYIRGGFKMWSGVPVDGELLCKRKSLAYTSLLLPLPALIAYSNITSYMFAIDGTMLNAVYLMSVYRWYSSNNAKNAKHSFYLNLLYLPSILFLMAIHSKRWKYKKGEFISTHLAWLQDLGIEHCFYGHNKEYESSELPGHIVSCTSPFRNEIHTEKPVETLNITITDEETVAD